MFAIVSLTLGGLLIFAITLKLLLKPKDEEQPTINNPAFLQFQKTYFSVYYPALVAEWLQGPYLYKLYSHYGFIDTQIAVIYVCGFASSVLFGTYASFLADAWGRRKVCILFTLLYSFCCLTKASRNYAVLIFGRILGGISTSLLFSAFDSWYIYEHTQTHGFPGEWIQASFAKASFTNSMIAVGAGLLANFVTEVLPFGPVAPFLLAVPFLVVSGILLQSTWSENYGKKGKVLKPCLDSFKHIIQSQHVFLVGMVQSLFESVMYIFVFLWTPVLDTASPPLGLVFSCFMACTMIGTLVFESFLTQRFKETKIIAFVVYFVMLGNIFASISSANHPRTTFATFLFIEFMCGIYFPAIAKLRSEILPGQHHVGILNWFRVPVNAIAAVVLLLLHDTHSSHGITAIFALCAALLCIAGLGAVQLHRVIKEDDFKKETETIYPEMTCTELP